MRYSVFSDCSFEMRFRYCLSLVVMACSVSFAVAQPKYQLLNPSEQELDSLALVRAFEHAADMNPLNSLLVMRHGELVGEGYFRGMTSRRATNMKSASKSLLALLVGIAMDQGHFEGVNQPITPFFEEYYDEEIDPRKREITLKHVLQMSTGLETTSFYNYGRWAASRDWAKFAIDMPLLADPGERMIYSTGVSHLASIMLTKATGVSTMAFAREHLFDPLGINAVRWTRGPQGYFTGGNNVALRPRDMLKLGQLVLQRGSYNGEQLISEAWIEEATRFYFRSRYSGHDYGYYWWGDTFGGYETVFAWGYGGQYIFVIPEVDMVVVCTSNLENRPRGINHNDAIFDLLANYVLPTVLDPEPILWHSGR